MKNQIADPDAYREFCLSLGEVTEKMPFGNFAPRYASILALYVMGHMFTYTDVADYTIIYLKVDTNEVDELYAQYSAVEKPMNMSPRHWVGIRLESDMPPARICELIVKAYEIVKQQYTKSPKKKGAAKTE